MDKSFEPTVSPKQNFKLLIMAESFQWKDKVCLVTGASGGIGLALVKSFLERGAKCLMTDVNYKV